MSASIGRKVASRIALLRDATGWMLCPYCDKRAELVPIKEVYDGKDFGRPHAKIYRCVPCHARVGCHLDTGQALGNLANPDTRRARMAAHAAFDRLWQAKMVRDGCSKHKARQAGYRWLAERMGIDVAFCHISWMDEEACEDVVRICMAVGKPANDR